MITVTVHIAKVVVQPDDALRKQLAAVTQGLRRVEDQSEALRIQGEQFMTQQQEVAAGLGKLETSFDGIKGDIAALKALVAPQIDAETMARFNSIVAKYEALDAENASGGAPTSGNQTGDQV